MTNDGGTSGRHMLVLGSDYGSRSVVECAQSMGCFVTVADLMALSPAKEAADKALLLSTADIDGLALFCRERGVDSVMFGASDFNVSNARKLCRRLGLPIYCGDDTAWAVARNKRVFKDLCLSCGAPVAEDCFLAANPSDEELSAVECPVVVKPADLSGNRAMSYCRVREELPRALQMAFRASPTGSVVVERMLRGREFNVHYVLSGGKASLLYMSEAFHAAGRPANEYALKVTSTECLEKWLSEVDPSLRRVFRRAGCEEGIVWVDAMLDSDGSFYLLEMGYRFGGVMTYLPFKRATGFDAYRWMVECSLGVPHSELNVVPKVRPDDSRGYAASYHLFSKREGTIGRVSGLEEVSSMEDVWVDLPKGVGDKVRGNACMGLIGVYGIDLSAIAEKLDRINEVLSIKDENGDELSYRFSGGQLPARARVGNE